MYNFKLCGAMLKVWWTLKVHVLVRVIFSKILNLLPVMYICSIKMNLHSIWNTRATVWSLLAILYMLFTIIGNIHLKMFVALWIYLYMIYKHGLLLEVHENGKVRSWIFWSPPFPSSAFHVNHLVLFGECVYC